MERHVPREAFEFMSSAVSTEQPKGLLIREIAESMRRTRAERGRILVVAGPGLVHTGASRHLIELIENGFVQVLFAGNGLAVHDPGLLPDFGGDEIEKPGLVDGSAELGAEDFREGFNGEKEIDFGGMPRAIG